MAPMALPRSPPSPSSPDGPPKAVLPRRAPAAVAAASSSSALNTPAGTPAPPPGTTHTTTATSSASGPVTNPSLTTCTTAASSAVPSPPELDDTTSTGTGGGSGGGGNGGNGNGPTSAPSGRRTMASAGGSTAALASLGGVATAPPTAAVTPVTGLGKMAAAATAGKRRGGDAEPVPGAGAGEDDHPLSDRSLAARAYHTLHAMQHLFHLPDRWRLLRPLGQGAYGLVISVQDSLSGEPVAVKCITRVFDKTILSKRALREITLLRHFGEHENLTGLIDLDNVWDGYNEIYLYMEPMEADLHQIVRSGQPLSNLHIQFFLYQLLRGMKYIHSANVIHRDLKPGNLLVNSDCELKICDFGLARGFKPVTGETDQNEELRMTEYVATRWYRAPEIMLSNRRYTTAIDVWSIGCILGELLGGKPMFKGKDYVDQLNLILGVLGTPDDETLLTMSSDKARVYLRTLPHSPVMPFDQVLPNADPQALDLLGKLLAFDPTKRTDVVTALEHPYVGAYHDPSDEPECEVFDKWEEVEQLQSMEELRAAVTREIAEYRAEVRGMAEEMGDEDHEGDEHEHEHGYEEGAYHYEVEGSGVHSEPLSTDVSARESLDSVRDDFAAGIRGRLGVNAAQAGRAGAGAQSSPSPRTLSPDHIRSKLGHMAQAGRSPTLSPRRTLDRVQGRSRSQSRSRSRDVSPYTPGTAISAISEESFGHSAGGSAGGAHSLAGASHVGMSQTVAQRRPRRSSSMASLKRRSMSFLFGGGFGGGIGMTSMTAAGAGAKEESAIATASSGEHTAGSMVGRRSRAPSGTASLRPLIRQLSTTNLEDMHRAEALATDDEPLITHSPGQRTGSNPSSATDGALSMSMSRRSSRAGSERKKRPVSVPVAA